MTEKTNGIESAQLNQWLDELDVGKVLGHRANSTNRILGDLESLGWTVNYPVPIPESHLHLLIKSTHDGFREAISEDYLKLKELKRSLSSRMARMVDTVTEHRSQVEQVETIGQHFQELADSYSTLEKVEAHRGVPEGLRSLEDLYEEDEVVEDLPTYAIDPDAFGGEKRDGWICFLRSDSPLRVAAYVRLLRRRLTNEYTPFYRVFAVGLLRLRILKHVLAYFEITGHPPPEITIEEAQAEAKALRKGGKRGRPPKGDPEKQREIIEELLSRQAFWHFTGPHQGKPTYKALRKHVAQFHSEDFKVEPDALRKKIKRWDLDLDSFRDEVGAPPPHD